MLLSRRDFLCAAALSAARQQRPNVLVFMSDQESALLPGPAELPNRGRLEKDAMRFTHAFCNTPQCSAARSSLLTGLEPHRTQVLTNVDGGSLGKPLGPAIPNIGNVLGAAGYSTGYFGKWHLGGKREQFGFETTGVENPDEAVARAAAGWIRKQRAPWLAWVSVINPHNIYNVPKVLRQITPRQGVRPPASGLANLAGKPGEQQAYVDKDQGAITRNFSADDWLRYRSYYLELVEKVDGHLGAVLAAISDLDSTVVVYTSDHGDALGEHGLPFKGPFMYEEEIRIPLIVRAPRLLAARERSDLVTQSDLAPTLAALCGVKWPRRVTGRDLTDMTLKRDAVFLEYYAKQKWVNPIRTMRGRRWKMNWYDSGHKELYDLERDPHELRNRAGDAETAGAQAQMETRLNAWRGPMS